MQCQNFERGESSAASASKCVVPSNQLSPGKSSPKCPELDRNKEAQDKATKTSPYFKKHNFQQEIKSKTVVRTIDLGSLSSKLSKRCPKVPATTPADDKPAPVCPDTEGDPADTLSSSQKENVLIQSLQDTEDCVTVIDLTTASGEMPTTALSSSQEGHNSETTQNASNPRPSSSSKFAKRKKETFAGKMSVRKKTKYDGTRREPEDMQSAESTAETNESDQHKTEAASSTPCGVPVSAEEVCEESDAVMKSDSLPKYGAEQTTSGQPAGSSHPPRLPYYLHNFRSVLQVVLDNEDDRALFNQDDMSLVHAFEKLSGVSEHHSLVTYVLMNPGLIFCVCFPFQSWDRNCM